MASIGPALGSSERQQLASLSRQVNETARDIHILSQLTWPSRIRAEFLKTWRAGEPRLPRVEPRFSDFSAQRSRLAELAKGAAAAAHPAFAVVAQTAGSYIDAIDLLAAQGTPAFTELSQRIYGSPVSRIRWVGRDTQAVAHYFIEQADRFHGNFEIEAALSGLSAQDVKQHLEDGMREAFGDAAIPVVISEDLSSKAAAGGTRVRLRADASFSFYDAQQLLQHEVMIHSLTAINGRKQTILPSLGLGSPRTTATQEGLATFAETITGNMDLARMKRISLRILAIELALEGADFIEVFRFFLNHGQSEDEGFNSAARIFRGGDVRGRYPFTKDTVYAEGWLSVVAFFVWCLRHDRLDLARHLFCGRVHLSDVFALSAGECAGVLDEPAFLPGWFRHIHTLAGSLAMMNVLNGLHIEDELCVDAYRGTGRMTV